MRLWCTLVLYFYTKRSVLSFPLLPFLVYNRRTIKGVLMKLFPMFFIVLEIINFIFYKRYYYYTQWMTALLRKEHKDKLRIVLVNKITLLFLANYILHFFFLAYCIYLMFIGNWQPGCMLLLLASLESFSVQKNIEGVTIRHANGFTYPKPIFKYFISTLTIFILLNLAQ